MRLALGDAEFDVTHRAAGHGHPQPHAGLVLRRRALLRLRRVPAPRRPRSWPTAPTSSTWVASRPGPASRSARSEELERVVPAVEALRGPVRPAALGRHVAGVGARRRASRPGPSSATTSAASPTRDYLPVVREARRVGGRHPHPAGAPGARSRPGLRRASSRRSCRFLRRAGRRGRRRPASRRSGSWSTPASTSARPSRSRSSCSGRPTGWPRSATRCSSRPRTSASSASCSACAVDERRLAHGGRPRPRHRPRLPGAAGPRRARQPAGGRRDGRHPGGEGLRPERRMAELHLVHGADEALVGQAATDLVRRLVGAADRSLMVADLTLDGDGRHGRSRGRPRRRPRRS